MDEPNPAGPGGAYQPYPGGSRQPDHWPDEYWFRPDREPDPHDVAGERVHGRHRPGDRRPPDLDRTADLDLRECAAGRNWLLITGTVFFLIDTFLMTDGFARPVAAGSRVLVVFIWLIGLAAVALLWRRASSRFVKPQSCYPGGDQGFTRATVTRQRDAGRRSRPSLLRPGHRDRPKRRDSPRAQRRALPGSPSPSPPAPTCSLSSPPSRRDAHPGPGFGAGAEAGPT
jgi:hypothetical protein